MGEGWKRGVACPVHSKPGTRAGTLGFRAGQGAFAPFPTARVAQPGATASSTPQSWVFTCFLWLSAPSINTGLLQGRETAASRLGSASSDRALGMAVVYLTLVALPARGSMTPSRRWPRAFHLSQGNVFFTLSTLSPGSSADLAAVISLTPRAAGGLHLEVPPA